MAYLYPLSKGKSLMGAEGGNDDKMKFPFEKITL
jgi:hypothetical protein